MNSTGYLVDPHDSRDLLLEEAPKIFGSTPPPDEFHAMAELYIIHIWQHAESCVGYAVAEALVAAWLTQGIVAPQLASPLFIWWNARKTHGAESINSGTYIRMALRQLKKVGFCPNNVWPGTDTRDLFNFAEQPPRAAFKHAIDQKMTDLEFYRVSGLGDDRINSWKQSLSTNHPIVFGVPIERSFHSWNGSGDYIEAPALNAKIIGGHAMCALGYDKTGVFGPQTWGPDWGRNGWFYMTWEYIRTWASDQWAVRAPQYFSETT